MRWWPPTFTGFILSIILTVNLEAMNGVSPRTGAFSVPLDCVLITYPAPSEPALLTELFPEAKALCLNAEEKSVDAKVSQLRLKDARMRAQADRSWLFPTLSMDTLYTRDIEDRPDFPTLVYHNYYTATTVLAYPLYHWGGPSAIARRGRENLKQAKIQAFSDRQSQTDQILDIYFSLMIKTRRLAVGREELALLEKQAASVGDNVQVSAKQQEERRLQLAQRQLDLQQLANDVDSTRRRLDLLTGGSSELTFTFAGFPEHLEIPARWTVENAVKPPAVYDYESRARAQKAEEVIARSDMRPHIDLVGGFYQDRVDGINVSRPIERNNYYMAFRVHWDIFDGLRASSNVAVARARARVNRELARQAQLRASGELEDNLRSLKILTQQYDIALSRQKIALQECASQEELNKQGQNSQEGLENARHARAAAEISALESLANFLKLYEKTRKCFDVAKKLPFA